MRRSLTEKFLWVAIAAAYLVSIGHVATSTPSPSVAPPATLTPSPCPTPEAPDGLATGDGGAMLPLGWVSAVAWHD